MSIEKGNHTENNNSIVPTLQEQRNFLLLWRKLTPSQKNVVQRLIETMLEKQQMKGRGMTPLP